jgi:GH15 family glucan-1,4-alpha-glucosidase
MGLFLLGSSVEWFFPDRGRPSPVLGLIGNCSYNALLDAGSVEWLCWPAPDSSFVFGPLLDRERGGTFVIEGAASDTVRQDYLENTNVLRTVFEGPGGAGRTRDYRYCWLRDAYFTLNAFERLGQPDEMELFLVVQRNLAADRWGELAPVCTITAGADALGRRPAGRRDRRGAQRRSAGGAPPGGRGGGVTPAREALLEPRARGST